MIDLPKLPLCMLLAISHDNPRLDFYQTSTSVMASLYLKNIDKRNAMITFASPISIELDLPTMDSKRCKLNLSLFGPIEANKSNYKIMNTKLELMLHKADGRSWPRLRSDDNRTNEIIQIGQSRKI